MKRSILPLILLCMLLCACGKQAAAEHLHYETEPAVQPTEPGGCYVPDSGVEMASSGAVRAYAMEENAYAMAAMGEDILIFSGTETTVLTRRSGENLYLTATVTLDTFLEADDPSVRVSQRGVVYFSPKANALIVLDDTLNETEQIELPGDLIGNPILSEDRNYVYYCTSEGLRCLDLEAGISRLIKELGYNLQSVAGLLLDETVILVRVWDGSGRQLELACAAESGKTLYSGAVDAVSTVEDRYFAAVLDDVMPAYVFGAAGQEANMVALEQVEARGAFLQERMQFVSVISGENLQLGLYDLESGRKCSAVTIPEGGNLLDLQAGARPEQVYLLCKQENGTVWLYRWDSGATAVEDDTVYTGQYFHEGNPDEEGLAQCREMADEIGQRHGVKILLGEDAVAEKPRDYLLKPEYQVPVIKARLSELDWLLAGYPRGFLTAAAEGTGDQITICLVKEIHGSPESGNTAQMEGAQFRNGNRMMVALALGGDLQQNLYHQMYYAIETRLLSNSNDCYQWDKLNPKKFSYDYDLERNAKRSEEQYLSGKNRYFVDVYSMFSPSTDRATIMQYAMTSGNEEIFKSEYMQKKLKTLCTGIREAYGLKQARDSFLWEQYLKESIAYKE